MIKPALVFHHFPCFDGFSAGCVVARALEDLGRKVELVGLDYGQPLPVSPAGREVIMVDVSLSRGETEALIAQAESYLLLDHHITARDALADLASEKARFVFDFKRCGATIAWRHFYGDEPLPEFLRYIQDIDLWTKKLEHIDAFGVAMIVAGFDRALWTSLIYEKDTSAFRQLIADGLTMRRLFDKQVSDYASSAFPVVIDGIAGVMVNAPKEHASDLGAALSRDHAFAIIFQVSDTHVNLSFRSKDPTGANVSQMAKTLGGGGHKHASGARLELDEGIAWLKAARASA